jgi:hypothetical protein
MQQRDGAVVNNDVAPPVQTAPAAAPQATALDQYLATHPQPDPTEIAVVINANPQNKTAMIQLLQTRFGNSFVQKVVAAMQPTAPASPLTMTDPSVTSTNVDPTSAPPAPTADANLLGPQPQDLGILGHAAMVDSAIGMSTVQVPMAESVITSVDANMTPTFTTSVTVPLASINSGVSIDKLQHITAVHLSSGAGGGGIVTFAMVGDAIRITIAGIGSAQTINATAFKLFCASGDTVILNPHVAAFHVDQGEYVRADARDRMRQAAEQIARARAAESNETSMIKSTMIPVTKPGLQTPPTVKPPTPVPPTTAAPQLDPLAPDPTNDPFIAEVQGQYRAAQAALAAAAGPSYVTLDARGLPIA